MSPSKNCRLPGRRKTFFWTREEKGIQSFELAEATKSSMLKANFRSTNIKSDIEKLKNSLEYCLAQGDELIPAFYIINENNLTK